MNSAIAVTKADFAALVTFDSCSMVFSATSMVATPHRGDCFLSVDLSPDESPATSGRRGFAQTFSLRYRL